MLKSIGFFSRKKSSRPFKDFYLNWFNTLKNHHLPLLRRSISTSSPTLLPFHLGLLHHHFQSLYHALDLAASHDLPQLLHPSWRNPLELPFLWLGDLHPYLFTNLLRSFFSDDDVKIPEFYDKPWQIAMAWKNPPENLIVKIEQIECGLRLMVPALVTRMRNAQAGFVERVAREWVGLDGKKEREKAAAIGGAAEAEAEEMVSVFLDANRLRRSVLAEIVGALSVYQAALFLEGLAQFLVGFREPELLGEFKRCKTPLKKQAHLSI